MSGIKIERLADRAVEAIQDEMNKLSQDDLSTWDHERFIHETIDSLMPTGNWEFTEGITGGRKKYLWDASDTSIGVILIPI